jgi:hypothetical protein
LFIKNVIFWNVTLCGSCKNRRFGRRYRLHHQGGKNQRARYWILSTVTAEIPSTDTFLPDERCGMFLRNVGCYKSHTASHPRRWHSS